MLRTLVEKALSMRLAVIGMALVLAGNSELGLSLGCQSTPSPISAPPRSRSS